MRDTRASSAAIEGRARSLVRERADVGALDLLKDVVPVFRRRRRVTLKGDVALARRARVFDPARELDPRVIGIDRGDDSARGGQLREDAVE